MSDVSLVAAMLQSVDLGSAQSFRNLTVFPLLAREPRVADYATLDDALANGAVQITEVGEAGSVPELALHNGGAARVLLVDGEELVGAKQNRVLNLTLLVPPASDLVIPVSCVEAGRWRHVSRHFSSSPRAHFAEGRAAKMRSVTESMRSSGSRRSDQSQVWQSIAYKSSSMGSVSDTSAMSDMFEQHEDRIDDFVSALGPVPNQACAVFAINGRIVGLDLFDAPGTWQKLAPKLVRSYALDAIDRQLASGSVEADAVRVFMDAVGASGQSAFPATGVGYDLRLSSETVAGAALVADGRVVHMSAFAEAGK